jgi:LuxR family transcriptional regulator, quorum-sensing system regulator BjaR1
MTGVPAYDDAFDLMAGLDQVRDIDAIVAGVGRILARYGITRLIFTQLPEAHFERAVLASCWPAEFLDLYIRNDYIRVDPIARQCRRSSRPFEWTAAQYYSDPEPRAAEVMRRAADFGLQRGFIVPINNPDGFEACVSMSGVHLELTARTKPLIHLVALYGYERVRQLVGLEPDAKPQLTPREREVLKWAARGKSAWEIGEILAIGKRTVDEHAATAVRKLGADNRAHAIAIALRDKAIEL